jgi:uncharacterized protein YbjT (DUF2867 family)
MTAPTSSTTPAGWRQGPVAITGASGQVGTALQRRLAAFPNQVRPLGRGDDLARAFADAEVVVHLAGTLQPREPNSYTAANLGSVQATVAALAGSRVQRVVFLSFATADLRSPNPYLRAKAAAETALRDSGIPATILRCHHIYGPPEEPGPMARSFLTGNGRSVTILGRGRQRLAPVYRDDVVEAIVHAALDPAAPVGTFELAGPQTITAVQFAHQLNPGPVRVRSLPAALARLLGRVVPSLPAALVEVMLSDLVPSAEAAATPGRFGIQLRRIEDVWRPQVGTGART